MMETDKTGVLFRASSEFQPCMEVELPNNLPLPDAFLDFLNENGLDPSIYSNTDPTSHYIRYTCI
ncbi:hypothetical protein RHGRI_003926 [Rhododendron griersonianum]|nr:hypothetical protein RHGRI_003926 [Rhododendron griersonianum]